MARQRLALVIGLGRSGLACARALSKEGYSVRVVDREDTVELRERAQQLDGVADVTLGGYPADVGEEAAIVCPSPGVPWDAPELNRARALGIPVRSELDLVVERCPARIIGVTGTNGKTTTASLVTHVLRQARYPVHLGGNIGDTVLDRLEEIHAGDWLVLELSSFQIESMSDPHCEIGAVLNVAPDHLDRHGSFAAYARIKARLAHLADIAVLNWEDEVTRGMAPKRGRTLYFGTTVRDGDGATVFDDVIVSLEQGTAKRVLPVSDVPLFGEHNISNVLAAVCIARAAGVATHEIAAAVRDFRAVAHRLQPVLECDGVLWVNDSKATNESAAATALRSFSGRPIIWIGGGSSKGVGPEGLAGEVAQHARYAVLIGATAPELDAALTSRGFSAHQVVADLHAAVSLAHDLARPGDVVLLAPGYASFDQFRDYQDRGDTFVRAVTEVAAAPRAWEGVR